MDIEELKDLFYEKWDKPHNKLYVRRTNKKGVFAVDEVWEWVESKLKEETDKAYNVGKNAGYKQGVEVGYEAGYEAGKKRKGSLVDKVEEDLGFGGNIKRYLESK